MDEKGFKAFLREGKRVPKGLKEDVIRKNVRMARRFEEYLKRRSRSRTFDKATQADAKSFIKHLMKTGENDWDGLLGLLRYARFADNRVVEVELLTALSGFHVLPRLLEEAKRIVGEGRYEAIFVGYEPPPLGTPPGSMPSFTQDFMERLFNGAGRETCREVLLTGVEAGPPEAYADEKKMLRASKDINEFLAKRRRRLVELLEEHMRDGTLFYTQPIDQRCIDFVRGNPEIAGGVRRGDSIYQTKIPYMMIEYLREKNPKMRRYYYCHCPLARESILTGEEISRDFCYCSAGFEKKPYEIAFGGPVKTTVLKSVLWGDDVCRFRMEIPEKYRKGTGRKRPARAKKPKTRRGR